MNIIQVAWMYFTNLVCWLCLIYMPSYIQQHCILCLILVSRFKDEECFAWILIWILGILNLIFVPAIKICVSFFEDNGLIDPVLRQFRRQSGDQTQSTRRKMFPCQNRLYGNEQLYNHMVQKKRNVIFITFSGCISKLHMVISPKIFIPTKNVSPHFVFWLYSIPI